MTTLEVDQVSHAFVSGGPSVISDVSFKLGPGACCLLVGDNGTGKTTIGKILCGLQGEVLELLEKGLGCTLA